jgi:hypothetical protein
MKSIAVALIIVACTAATALADGKMFWREKVPPKIPYQRALILYRDGTETLVLQSRYEIPKTGEKTKLGWVVPVPAVPEIASMPAETARHMFMYLSMNSRPRETRIGAMLFGALFLGVAGISLITLLLCLVSFVVPMPSWFKHNRGRLARYSMFGLLLCLLAGVLLPSLASARGSFGVDVITEQRVGIYDVRVVRSDDANGLISWLNTNSFSFAEQDAATFDSYVSKGWCFVVAIINPTAHQKEGEIVAEGLAAPLILRFPHASPIYPLALTGTGGYETEILIYFASERKMSAGGSLTLRYAGPMYDGNIKILSRAVEPGDFFGPDVMEYPYLCKFKDRLIPAQMNQDIVFRAAGDENPYREHVVKW